MPPHAHSISAGRPAAPDTAPFPVLHGLLELAKGIAIHCFCNSSSASAWEPVEYHGGGEYCPRSDPRAGDLGWPWRPRSGHSPTRDFPSPSAPPTARFPRQLGDDPRICETSIRRTCWQIGRASCRERVKLWVGAVTIKETE